MKCYRCSKSMVYEKFFGNQEHLGGWRCIFCGEIVDDVILENRQWLRKDIVPDNKKTRIPTLLQVSSVANEKRVDMKGHLVEKPDRIGRFNQSS